MSQFKPGDKVKLVNKLTIAPTEMIVAAVRPGKVTCYWFNNNNSIEEYTFPEEHVQPDEMQSYYADLE